MAFRMKVIQIPISHLLKRHDKQNLCWNMPIDKHKRNKEFTNIYCNCNKHLNYEAFYYMCENKIIFFYKIKIGVPTAPTNQSIIILQLFTKDGHI